MEPKYIFAIVALSLFFVLFLVFFGLLAHRRKMEAKLQAYLYEMYSDKNIIKMDYDSVNDDEGVQTPPVKKEPDIKNENAAEEEKREQEPAVKTDELYEKIEVEGIEEITGNYKPQ